MKKISAVIITKNEEGAVRRCLESVRWADEIVVVDALSADKTADICAEYTASIFKNAFTDFSAQKNFAMSKAKNDWVLFVDADESISPALRDEISALDDDGYDGYYIPRRNIIFGRHLKYGGHQGDVQLRLFRKSKSRFENPIHEKVMVAGSVGKLRNDIEHNSTRSLSEYTDKLNLYTDLEAGFMKSQARPMRKRHLIMKPAAQFILSYICKAGYRDGMEGFLFYSLSSFYTFVKYAKYWDLLRKEGRA